MISRWRIITLSSLCLISTIACGFSAWVWTENNEPEVSIDVEVGEVVQSSLFSNFSTTGFAYCNSGIEYNYMIVDYAKFSVDFDVDCTLASSSYVDTNSTITLVATVSCVEDVFITLMSKPIVSILRSDEITYTGTSTDNSTPGTRLFTSTITAQLESTGTNHISLLYSLTGDISAYKDSLKKLTFSLTASKV